MRTILLSIGVFAVASVGSAQTDSFVWHGDLAAAREIARKEGRPIFLVFR